MEPSAATPTFIRERGTEGAEPIRRALSFRGGGATMRGVCLALVFAAVVSIATGTAAAANYAQESLDRYFRIKYQEEANAARSVVSGYGYNMHPGLPVDRMQLDIEALDASGKVVGTSSTWIPGGVPAGNRSYFSASVISGPSTLLRPGKGRRLVESMKHPASTPSSA
jgi:hypothetical protein